MVEQPPRENCGASGEAGASAAEQSVLMDRELWSVNRTGKEGDYSAAGREGWSLIQLLPKSAAQSSGDMMVQTYRFIGRGSCKVTLVASGLQMPLVEL